MTTTEMQTEAFDAAVYDLEGTPVLNGRKAKTVVLQFEPHELDRTDADDMELAGKLEPGEEIRLSVLATVSKRAWQENPEEVRVVYRIVIEELA